MKTKAILLLVASIFLTGFMSSCGDETPAADVVATGINIDMDSLSVEKGAVGTLVATLEPTGATGDIMWTSSDASVAVVNNGIVTGISVGEATIAAASGVFSSTCVVTVTPEEIDPNDLPASLSGSNYHIIHIDETTFEFIKDDVDNDFRPDDVNKFLYIWDNTFTSGTTSGLNFYNQAESWISLTVASIGWSGAGYHVDGTIDMTDLAANPEDYAFHIALKSGQPSSSYLFIFTDGSAEAKICIGSAPFVDGATYPVYKDFTHDNEWQSIEIPVTKLNEMGLFFTAPFTADNVFSYLAGGIAGTTLEYDAAFFYKK